MKTNMSAGHSDCVVLFKAVSESENEDDDVYSNLFCSNGFQVTLTPVLDFEFVNLDDLYLKLKNPNHYEGIIFTSPRCVRALELSVHDRDEISVLEKWRKHTHFVVGEKTARMIEKVNFIPSGKESGNAKNLAEIMTRGSYTKPFLYLKGSLTKDNFKLLLKEGCINVDDIIVYRTKQHPELESNITKIKSFLSVKAVYFVYFSPSGVNFTLPLFEKHKFDLHNILFIAIGPTTDAALKENGLKVAAVAAKPDPNALLEAVLKYIQKGLMRYSFLFKSDPLTKKALFLILERKIN